MHLIEQCMIHRRTLEAAGLAPLRLFSDFTCTKISEQVSAKLEKSEAQQLTKMMKPAIFDSDRREFLTFPIQQTEMYLL